ncbi:hypothetical protein ACFST9_14755, partial [Hymenobacter monticola]|uniref:hypothetical protein n=1 Tax=Hymenobacter monticola TaxID=1705399 RepID=UPI00363845E0
KKAPPVLQPGLFCGPWLLIPFFVYDKNAVAWSLRSIKPAFALPHKLSKALVTRPGGLLKSLALIKIN